MKTVARRLKLGGDFFRSSTSNTPVFNQFFDLFKKDFTKELMMLGAEDIEFTKGHFYISGFFRLKEQWIYFSLSDVRSQFGSGVPQLLVRTAKHNKDFTGGINNYVNIEPEMYKSIANTFSLATLPKSMVTKEKKVKDTKYYAEKAIKDGFLNMYTGSLKKANYIAWKVDDILKGKNQRGTSITEYKRGRWISSAKCNTEQFNYYYDGNSKRMSIEIIEGAFDEEKFLKTLPKYSSSELRINPFTGHGEQLEPKALALYDFIKDAEINNKPFFQTALYIFRKTYPDTYHTLLD